MKKLYYLTFAAVLLFSACGHRNIPTKSVTQTPLHPRITPDRIPKDQYVKRATVIDSTNFSGVDKSGNSPAMRNANSSADSATAAVSAGNLMDAPIVVIDNRGKLMIDSLNLPPTVTHNLDSLSQVTRAFTPDQAKNLAYRFKEIPPRVLFVPDNLAKKGKKGYYYKYNDKFWYWKKDDGFFYLDENYYQ